MRAESLGDAGRKIELLNEMMARLERRVKMADAITARADRLLSGKVKRRKRKQLEAVKKRLEDKKSRDAHDLQQMRDHKEKMLHNLKIQRESLGIMDHSWLDRLG
jgi:hypothetical protein